MKLMTKEIERKARKQFPQGNSLQQMIVAKFFDPCSQWTWYLMNQDPADPDYLWGIVKGDAVETGSFSLSDLQKFRNRFGLNIERDKFFKPLPAAEVLERLEKGVHV